MKIEVRYSWRYKWSGRLVTSRTKMTEEQAYKNDPKAVRLDDTREETAVMNQPCEIDQANINLVARGIGGLPDSPARLYRPKTLPQEADFVCLPLAAELYLVTCDGDLWTVTSMAANPPRIVYQGLGPVSVEPTP